MTPTMEQSAKELVAARIDFEKAEKHLTVARNKLYVCERAFHTLWSEAMRKGA